MSIAKELVAELNLLMQFDLSTTQAGIKVHSDADAENIAAIERLHEKGLVSQVDGGYLTGLGHDAAEHIQSAIGILKRKS
ncbi:MAG: TIGR02647 family protein [Cellvibrionaceae bacterium]